MIKALQIEIKRKLRPIIDSDYSLLDIPDYPNIGDQLILKGESDFLRKHVSFKETYRASIRFFDETKIDRSSLILLQGGGNFGDIWPRHQKFRERIVQKFKNNKIILFPQTVYFGKKQNLEIAIHVFSKHDNLTLCARDQKSYVFFKNNFKKNTILLLPDMAFATECHPIRKPCLEIKKVLFLCRNDKELPKTRVELNFIRHLEIHDWPTFPQYMMQDIMFKLNRAKNKCFWHLKKTSNKYLGSYFYEREPILISNYNEHCIKAGVSMFSKFDLVITNRLHGHILATKLGIPNIFLDNLYGKNKWFYDTWMKEVPNCFFAENVNEVKRIIKEYFPECMI